MIRRRRNNAPFSKSLQVIIGFCAGIVDSTLVVCTRTQELCTSTIVLGVKHVPVVLGPTSYYVKKKNKVCTQRTLYSEKQAN